MTAAPDRRTELVYLRPRGRGPAEGAGLRVTAPFFPGLGQALPQAVIAMNLHFPWQDTSVIYVHPRVYTGNFALFDTAATLLRALKGIHPQGLKMGVTLFFLSKYDGPDTQRPRKRLKSVPVSWSRRGRGSYRIERKEQGINLESIVKKLLN